MADSTTNLPLAKLGKTYTDKAVEELLRPGSYHESSKLVPLVWSWEVVDKYVPPSFAGSWLHYPSSPLTRPSHLVETETTEPFPVELPGVKFRQTEIPYVHAGQPYANRFAQWIKLGDGRELPTVRDLSQETNPEIRKIWNRMVELAANRIRNHRLSMAHAAKNKLLKTAKKKGISLKEVAEERKKNRILRLKKKQDEIALDNFNRLFKTSKELTQIHNLSGDVMKKLERLVTAEKIPKITYVDNKLKEIRGIHNFLRALLAELSE